MSARKVLAGNWKMFKTRAEVKAFFTSVGSKMSASKVRKIVAPSPVLLETAVAASKGTGIDVFAQNVHWSESGAFTGETSAAQLLELGVKGALVGHSERRQYFGETDPTAAKRAAFALSKGLEVIYCFGETIEQRKAGQTEAVIREQLALVIRDILPKLSPHQEFMLAYEPVWAIGTGVTATPDQVREAHAFIGKLLREAGKPDLAILYGGSVKTDNLSELAIIPLVYGGLVGGASLESDSYLTLHEILDKSL